MARTHTSTLNYIIANECNGGTTLRIAIILTIYTTSALNVTITLFVNTTLIVDATITCHPTITIILERTHTVIVDMTMLAILNLIIPMSHSTGVAPIKFMHIPTNDLNRTHALTRTTRCSIHDYTILSAPLILRATCFLSLVSDC